MVTACEDIGMAYPMAVTIVKSCVDCAMQLGFPEARIPLAEAVILLATAPKSNSAICAIDAALEDIKNGLTGEIPAHLRDSHYKWAAKMGRGKEYKYPHDYPELVASSICRMLLQGQKVLRCTAKQFLKRA